MVKKLIRCSMCNQVIPDYGGSMLTKSQTLPGVEWSDTDLAGAKDFLRKHSGHPLEQLSVDTDSIVSEKPAHEPVGVNYVLAGNAERKFLIRRTRMALDQPASYEVVPGKLKLSNVFLRIQEYDLRRQIALDKRFSLLLRRKMEKFIETFREETAGIKAEEFEQEAEWIEDGETSLVAYGSLSESRWAKILKRCGRYFKESDLEIIKEFIEENRVPPDVLSVQIQRRISIIKVVEGEAAVSAQTRVQIGVAAEAQSDAIGGIKVARGKK